MSISNRNKGNKQNNIRCWRGDLFYADMGIVEGSEQGGVRPVLIIQNDTGNKHSPTVICAAITSQMHKAKLPTHVEISAENNGLAKNSVVLMEQLRTIDKRRLQDLIGYVEPECMDKINNAMSISLGLGN